MPGTDPPNCEFDSDKLILRINMTVAGDVKAIAPVVEQVMANVKRMQCGVGSEFDIELALQEALANAVVHGCREDPEKQVQVWVWCDESKGMIIVVRDPGPGFDPKQIPSPVVGERVFSDHGRGIYLINQIMDEVHFKRGGAEIWMRKRR
jgi:serine/threonine-protein kinase RsbW